MSAPLSSTETLNFGKLVVTASNLFTIGIESDPTLNTNPFVGRIAELRIFANPYMNDNDLYADLAKLHWKYNIPS